MPATGKAADVWVLKKAAAEQVGVDERQIRRYIAQGRVRRRIDEHGVAYVNLEDVKRVQKEIQDGQMNPQQQLVRAAPPVLLTPKENPEAENEPAADKGFTPEPKRPPRALCSIAETVRYFGVKRKWLLEHVRAGRIPAVNFGSEEREDWRIDRDGLMRAVRALVELAAVRES